MTSFHYFLVLFGAVVVERCVELVLTQRNARKLLARGGRVVGDAHYPAMVVLHTSLLVAAPLEVGLLERPFLPGLGWPMLALVVGTMGLRYWAISSLGDRWTTRIFVVPGEAPRLGGPYRFLRHPNYLAVILEVAALPLVHTAWITALVCSLLNMWILRIRIQAEEAALAAAFPLDDDPLSHLPRLLPTGRTGNQR